jgi:type I restriction enzyme S subunit
MKKKATTAKGKASNRQPTLDFTFTSAIAEEHQANSDKSTSTMQAPRVSPLDESSWNSVNLPKGWQQQTLGVACDIFAGFGFPERFQGKTTGDLPFYKVGDISETWKRGDVLLTRSNNYVTHDECRELRAKPLPAGTTVFAKIGAAIALNRRAMLTEPSLVDNNVMGLHPKSQNLNDRFLFHFACTLKLNELSRATTVPSIRKSDVEAIDIPIPPRPEQIRIVAEIEKQFTRLDAGVAALKRVQANLKRYRAAVLKAACEGKLVPTEAELARHERRTYETGEQLLQRILNERIENWQGRGKFKVPFAPDSARAGNLPEGWTWATLDQICDKITDGEHLSPETTSSGVCLLSAKDVREAGVQLNDPKYVSREDAEQFRSRCNPGKGDVLIVSRGATIGRICVVQIDDIFCLMGSVILLKPNHVVSGKFLSICLNDRRARVILGLLSGSTAQQAIYIRDIRPFALPLPPLAEQTRIVAEVERRLSVVEELEAVVAANLQRANRLRQSILQKAFTGELTGDGTCLRDSQASVERVV